MHGINNRVYDQVASVISESSLISDNMGPLNPIKMEIGSNNTVDINNALWYNFPQRSNIFAPYACDTRVSSPHDMP